MSFYESLLGRYVPGYGNINAKLGILGEAPGPDEAEAGIPFVGATGRMLAESLREAGLDIDDCYRTNVFKWFPGSVRFDSDAQLKEVTGHTLQEGLPQLWEEINLPSINCWLAVGDLACSTLTGKTGIFTYRGSILQSLNGKKKVIPTVHPAALFKTKGSGDKSVIPWRFWYIIKQDIYRAVEDSELPELRLPVRQHGICRSSLQLEKFLQRGLSESPRYNGHVLASVDIEASHNIPITIAIAFNSKEALSVALFNIGSWSSPGSGLPTGERVRIWKLLYKFFSDKTVKFIGQNFKYDHEKIENTLGFTIGRDRLHADVGLMSHTIQPEFRVALEFLTSIYTREPYYKDEGKEFDLSSSPLEQLMTYNCKDALVTYEIYEKLLLDLKELNLVDFYFQYKNRLHDFYMAMERTGFKVDEAQRSKLWDKYVDWYNAMDAEMKAVTGFHINPNAPHDVKWLLERVGLPERADTGKETVSLLYANHAKTDAQKVACRNILKMRSARKTMSQYIGVLPDFDGRVRSSWRIAGTETDRSATHMLEPPVRPKIIVKPPKGPAKKRDIGTIVHNLTKYGEVGQDVRTIYVPDTGYWYGSADLSQAEAHIVANLADDKELLKLLWSADIHTLTASWLFGVHVSKISKKSPLRQIAKAVRHAGHYGMGKRKLVELLAAASMRFDVDLVVSEWKAGQLLGVFHEYTPKIHSVFHEAVRYCINKENRTLVNPFGWPRTFHERYGDELFREAYAHIPQSTVPQQTKMAGLRVWDREPNIRWVSEQHDSLDWMCLPEDFDRIARVVKEELEKPIDFSRCSIPRDAICIPAEIKVAKLNYCDFEDYKFVEAA